jgi:hypothetical protein
VSRNVEHCGTVSGSCFIFAAHLFPGCWFASQCELLATFLTELALPEYGMLKYTASLLSAGAVYAALKTLNRNPFPPALAHYSEYTEAQIRYAHDAVT